MTDSSCTVAGGVLGDCDRCQLTKVKLWSEFVDISQFKMYTKTANWTGYACVAMTAFVAGIVFAVLVTDAEPGKEEGYREAIQDLDAAIAGDESLDNFNQSYFRKIIKELPAGP